MAPINQSLMKSMSKQYGKKAGKNIYFATEAKMKKESPRKAAKMFNVRKK